MFCASKVSSLTGSPFRHSSTPVPSDQIQCASWPRTPTDDPQRHRTTATPNMLSLLLLSLSWLVNCFLSVGWVFGARRRTRAGAGGRRGAGAHRGDLADSPRVDAVDTGVSRDWPRRIVEAGLLPAVLARRRALPHVWGGNQHLPAVVELRRRRRLRSQTQDHAFGARGASAFCRGGEAEQVGAGRLRRRSTKCSARGGGAHWQ